MADMQVVRSVDNTRGNTRGNTLDSTRGSTLGSRRLAALLTATAGERPGYRALAQGVRTLLLDGRIALHSRLPAERELATALGISRATVTAAYDLLRTDGFAHSRRGSGTWTALPAGRRPSNVAYADTDDVIDLAMAAPHAPQGVLADALAAVTGAVARHGATAGYHPYGLPELRAAVADRFTRRGLPTLPEQILITSGAQQAVSLTLSLLSRPGDRVLVENPSYANVLDAVRRGGLRATPVPVTDDGWDAEVAESTLRQAAPRLAYLVPDFHNPTGRLMPVEQRRRLLDTARRTGTWLIVDETLTDIALDVPAPAPFASLAAGHGVGEQLVTVGSLSKTHWGGLRIGWVRASSQLITELATHRVPTDIAGSVLDQLLAIELVERTEAVLKERLPLLRAQRSALAAALAEQLPEWRWQLPPGGLCLWVDLGAPVSSALASAALDHGVRIEGGARFGADPGTHEHRLRIPYALPAELCVAAVGRLAATLAAGLPAADGAGGRRHWVA
ncbi:PLP-dependent aminotransferase family protein [Streptomyces sp. B-S-A8]|uniref:PLP-dependent aminotransferase family protein n=1 Tax=Streptomyces solicavernae TaxID=3043614 RepID=A0ABT6RNA7_9ACTN|nr:PLP-dependent aminotransferase family protein [Streptomyces sp. B-S-A8]MDI3385181.1 PLP-dependent aminotransferase family protein [Streptomyces sp. B-S-A8]